MDNITHISLWKRVLVRLLVLVIKCFVVLARLLGWALRIAILPFRFLLAFLFSSVAVPLYKSVYLPLKVRITTALRSHAHLPQTVSLFSTKYVLHALMMAAVLFVAGHSVFARGASSMTSPKPTILSTLLKTNDHERFVEYAVSSPQVALRHDGIGGIAPSDVAFAFTDTSVTANQASSSLVKPALATTDVGARPRAAVTYHVVAGGETVSQIAEQYGISINTILWENQLSATSLIKPGLKLTILPMTGISHQVQAGETLASIIKKYGGDTQQVIETNKLANADAIAKNDILLIPNGKPPAPAPAPVTRLASASAAVPTAQPANSSVVPAAGKLLWPAVSHKLNQNYTYYPGGRGHSGIDIDGDYTSPIYAAADGVVTTAGWGNGYGLHVVLNHGGGMVTLYGHASKLFVTSGQRVSRGQTLGIVGCTGWCTGAHIHFEVRINGAFRNPLSYL